MRDTTSDQAYGLKLQLVEGSSAAMTRPSSRRPTAGLDRRHPVEPVLDVPEVRREVADGPEGRLPAGQSYYWIGHKGFVESTRMRVRSWPASMSARRQSAINGAVKDGKTWIRRSPTGSAAMPDLIKRWENIKKAKWPTAPPGLRDPPAARPGPVPDLVPREAARHD